MIIADSGDSACVVLLAVLAIVVILAVWGFYDIWRGRWGG